MQAIVHISQNTPQTQAIVFTLRSKRILTINIQYPLPLQDAH